jgi:hypothetical protein
MGVTDVHLNGKFRKEAVSGLAHLRDPQTELFVATPYLSLRNGESKDLGIIVRTTRCQC